MNPKQQIKEEKRAVKEAIQRHFKNLEALISATQINDVKLPKCTCINSRAIEDIFNNEKEKFFNKEFGKFCTVLKKDALSGFSAFKYKANFIEFSNTEMPSHLFNRSETLKAYHGVINELTLESAA